MYRVQRYLQRMEIIWAQTQLQRRDGASGGRVAIVSLDLEVNLNLPNNSFNRSRPASRSNLISCGFLNVALRDE